jgi:hypothetical protein
MGAIRKSREPGGEVMEFLGPPSPHFALKSSQSKVSLAAQITDQAEWSTGG